ncbi:hypothetical protein POM88_014183 [Heracleum sosnowskyi]|uniref:Replication protein n=1 Tax=Heracleum sosnowskyi TaxID=360622 RepID=A0AAD8J376_9APIA|nr:hypothetical protein POM88_014183 [Heracleum sosnowskyi]
MFDQLEMLDPARTNWKVKVRITRMWVSDSTAGSKDGSNSVIGYNAILLDDDNFHIQAFIYPDKWSQKVVEDDFMIPMYKFEFVDLGDLFEIINNHVPPLYPDYATDIIGVVENFEKLSPIPTKYGQRNIVKFRICDGRLAQQGYKTPEDIGAVSTVSNSVQVVETLTLKELTEKTSTDYIKRNVMCFVTIKRVEAGDSWRYYGCNFCHEEVRLLEGRYKCVNPKCLKSSPYAEKSYRIMVLAHDKTKVVNVVLNDRVVKRLVGKTATMLLEEIEDLAEV